MGTKGRDLAVWCFLLTSLVEAIFSSIAFLIIAIFWASLIFYHYTIERKKAIKYGQVFLVPINPIWAKILVKGRIKGKWDRAYEVHLNFTNEPLKTQLRSIDQTLKNIQQTPGLYIWETYLTVPRNIRNMIKELPGLAFWNNGCFIPRPPFAYQYHSHKHLKYGAILIQPNIERSKRHAQESHNYCCLSSTSSNMHAGN